MAPPHPAQRRSTREEYDAASTRLLIPPRSGEGLAKRRAMTRAATAWLVLGWIGYALLPWYAAGDVRVLQSALVLGLSGAAVWLLPIGLALLIATWPLIARTARSEAARLLVAAGVIGLALATAQGF